MKRGPERTTYLCHECGGVLLALRGARFPFYCSRCEKHRKLPSHPALISKAPS